MSRRAPPPPLAAEIRARAAGWLLLLALATCSSRATPIRIVDPSFADGRVALEFELASGYEPESVRLYLDGRRLPLPPDTFEGDRRRAGRRLRTTWPVSSGVHLFMVVADFEIDGHRTSRYQTRVFSAPGGAPALRGSVPAPGAHDFAPTEWLDLRFEAPLPDDVIESFRLACDGRSREVAVHALAAGRVVLNPARPLPPRRVCRLTWRGDTGPELLAFETGRRRGAARVVYDRRDRTRISPFPDDYFTRSDPTTATGLRLDVPIPEWPDVERIYRPLLSEVNPLDGFSPIAHLVIELSEPVDPGSVPHTPAESVDPLATIALIDVDPISPEYGRRVPFRLEARTPLAASGASSGQVLLLFPSKPLRPGGRYGVLVARRARAGRGRPFAPSASMAAVLNRSTRGRARGLARARALSEPILEVAEQLLTPPLPREDLALALGFTVRSLRGIENDLRAVREQVFAAPPPRYWIDAVEPIRDPAAPVAAIVHGRWQAPEWRTGWRFARDADGRPVASGTAELAFTLSLPRSARATPAPIVMYQHGNPGSAAVEVSSPARDTLSRAGFAIVGSTDVLNREVAANHAEPRAAITAQVFTLLTAILLDAAVPDYWLQTWAEQIAFLRVIEQLGELDLLPVGAPDGRPELDARAPLGYVGISEGANHAAAFLPFAPEVRAAALVAGGSRLAELIIHQDAEAFLRSVPIVLPGFRDVDVWIGLALFQAAFDRQDAHNYAHLLYRDPLPIGDGPRRASVLLVSGIDDHLVPNHATRSLAWQLGPIPQLAPVAQRAPLLEVVEPPLVANVDPLTTAGYVQYVPLGVVGLEPTPGCLPPALSLAHAWEGHYCAQLARESREQRAKFLLSALGGGPPVIDWAAAE